MLESANTERFPGLLDQAIGFLIDFDVSLIFAYKGRSRPINIYNKSAPETAAVVEETSLAYVQGPYSLDPFYAEVRRGRVSGVASLAELAPDEFYESEYFKRHYSKTKIIDEIGYFIELPNDVVVVHSIGRMGRNSEFTVEDYAYLAEIAPVLSALGKIHWADIYAQFHARDRSTDGSALDEQDPIEVALKSIGQGVLTQRQLEIISLLLNGHSSESIALHLNIGSGTVKNHRKNIYAKLGISSQSELFSIFLDCLRDNFQKSTPSSGSGPSKPACQGRAPEKTERGHRAHVGQSALSD